MQVEHIGTYWTNGSISIAWSIRTFTVSVDGSIQALTRIQVANAKVALIASIKGTGIGLSLSRQIVQLHGGVLHAHSIPERETVFSIKF